MSKGICETCDWKSLPDYGCVEGSLLRTSTDGLHTESCSDRMPLRQFSRLMADMTIEELARLRAVDFAMKNDIDKLQVSKRTLARIDEYTRLELQYLQSPVNDERSRGSDND